MSKDIIHFDLENLEIKKIRAKSQEVCPHCGNKEFLGKCEFLNIEDLKAEKKDIPAPNFKKR